ncbi:flagellar biosynthetic protein FliR [Aureimonas leprariae]|uniref:Flagellar type III secretion system protein FliR n=1 Tax=Plantimonas leprariae TaxID=2615207 RepID=A0A7V7TWP3_9HYPH|nr:flagellar biosynthetic protein FliR [Aureimonas leprariae]KAB0679889.1 flagellar type III secretion system protein FliR [Aureimonas leprariae]
MNADTSVAVLSLFLIFCRVGSCLMLLPGYSSLRMPVQIRLLVAVAASLVISPALLPGMQGLVQSSGDDMRLQLVVTEMLNGALIGLLGRVFMLALQFAGTFVANAIGMGNAFGVAMEDQEPAIASLITLTATVMIFTLNLHAEILRALVASYGPMPVAGGFVSRAGLVSLTDKLDETFMLCLRIASPFVVYGVIVNFAVGLMNKMTPQIPIYFISLPFVIAGGMVLLGWAIGDFLRIFVASFQTWVFNG